MDKVIHVELTVQSINKAIKEVRAYQQWLEKKQTELCKRLAEMGATMARFGYGNAFYSDDKDIDVTVEEADGGYRIIASGMDVLFVEFGAGIRYSGDTHPLAGELGYGAGTWPDPHYQIVNGERMENWRSPFGWTTPDGTRTFGNPPSRTMYDTAQSLKDEIARVAKEVFSE